MLRFSAPGFLTIKDNASQRVISGSWNKGEIIKNFILEKGLYIYTFPGAKVGERNMLAFKN